MTGPRTITKFTTDERNLPSFMSIEDLGDKVVITVRSRKTRDERTGRDVAGTMAEIHIPSAEWADQVTACNLHARK